MKRRLMWTLLAAIAGASTYATLMATPATKFTGTTLAVGRFDEIDVKNHTLPAFWQARLKTEGLSDLYVQSNVWEPGGSTGWHTHPGHSLIIVTAGVVTAYEGNDPSCTPHQYSAGMGFVDEGGSHVHILRNEDQTVQARTVAVQLIPAAATRRLDAPAAAGCPDIR
jgi:hypothetical protein